VRERVVGIMTGAFRDTMGIQGTLIVYVFLLIMVYFSISLYHTLPSIVAMVVSHVKTARDCAKP
jgi:hypothetical protein